MTPFAEVFDQGSDPSTEARSNIHAARHDIEAHVRSMNFPCVGGKTAWRLGTVRHAHFGRLGAADTTAELHNALCAFVATFNGENSQSASGLASFIATFEEPGQVSEEEFETLLWHQLQRLHERDAP